MTYILVVLVSIAGQWQSYVVDYGLTADDCRAALVSGYVGTVYDDHGNRVSLTGARITCKPER